MNRIFGFCSFDQVISESLLIESRFNNHIWTPDNLGHFRDSSILLTSTQRFITHQCHRTLMPYQHAASGLVVVADAYLTQRAILCEKLQVKQTLADAELILIAFLKWNTRITQHLAGEFCFAIWNPSSRVLFIATDHFRKRPLLYSYKQGHSFVFSNELSPFRAAIKSLTINKNMLAHIALDALPIEETCYNEVMKLQAGHQLEISPLGIKQTCYWQLKDECKTQPYRTREMYYEAFQEVFREAVTDSLRSPYAITAHLSGGLDSSSVTAQAAVILAKRNQPLYAFTAVPVGLDGPSYRKGWLHHELPAVQTLLDRYPNIKHIVYQAEPNTDMYQVLRDYYPYVDQPFRNISNLDWILGSFNHAGEQDSRTILTGARGNSGISWAASSWKGWLLNCAQSVNTWMRPHTAYQDFFNHCQNAFLKSKVAKQILRERVISWSPHYDLLSAKKTSAFHSGVYPISLCHGVVSLDPTHDLNVVKFCYNIPDWVCRDGSGAVHNRLLARRGLAHLLPEAIANNCNRGEQASDWFLQYNQHAQSWYSALQHLSPTVKQLLSTCYNQDKYALLEQKYPARLKSCDAASRKLVNYSFMRYLSAALFFDYLEY